MQKKYLMLLLTAITANLYAHGWQTLPLSRTEVLNLTDKAAVGYEPQSVNSNLVSASGLSHAEIQNYPGGPLAYFTINHAIQDNNLCSNGHTAWAKLLIATAPTNVTNGQQMTFTWSNTAPHNPSAYFVFVTNYKPGEYSTTPSWKELHYVKGCDYNGSVTSTTSWKCNLQLDQQIVGKQVLVTIWQRTFGSAENFVSCTDLNFSGFAPTPGEDAWTALTEKSWITGINQPKVGKQATFNLERNGVVIKTYSLAINEETHASWDSILAAKINTDYSLEGLIQIGVLNKATGQVSYDSHNQNKDYVYLNHSLSEPTANYSYRVTVEKASNPAKQTWSNFGKQLPDWLMNIKKGDILVFSLNVNGIETDTFDAITVTNPANAQKQMVTAINKHEFISNHKIKAGVLAGNKVAYKDNIANEVYVFKPANNTDSYTYVIRNKSQPAPNYKIYPDDLGKFKDGDLVKVRDNKLYKCIVNGWCNNSNSVGQLYYEPGRGLYWQEAWQLAN